MAKKEDKHRLDSDSEEEKKVEKKKKDKKIKKDKKDKKKKDKKDKKSKKDAFEGTRFSKNCKWTILECDLINIGHDFLLSK